MYIIIEQSEYEFSLLPSWCCFRSSLIPHKSTYKLVHVYVSSECKNTESGKCMNSKSGKCMNIESDEYMNTKSGECKNTESDECMNPELIGYYVYDNSKIRMKLILFQIHPEYVNMGHGSSIVSSIIQKYDKISLECDMECSSFYRNNGFNIYKSNPYSCKMII